MKRRDEASAAPENGGPGSQALEEIVAEYLDLLNAGNELDPLEIAARYPDQSEAILQQLYAFLDLGHSPEPDEPLGTLGDYTLRRQVGRGGMGVVYKAWESSMDRVVALKVLPGAVAADEKILQRFVREAKTAGQLGHPNVVSVHAMGVKEQTPYYAMEYVEGETLAHILSKIRDAEPETDTPFGKKDDVAYFGNLARAFADVADGLQHAHSKGVVHRDIKPSNLILDGEGRLRILDFGLAHLEGQESLTLSGDFLGTPLYMSPEQARRKKIPVDHRTDVYSLGATMYEAICGRPPFRGKDHADTLSQIIEREPVEPRTVNARVPKDLETIVLKCLRKDAGDRYGTAEALGQDLRRFVRGDPIEARPRSGWEKLRRSLLRYKGRLSAAALAALFLLTSGILLVRMIGDARVRRSDDYKQRVLAAVVKLANVRSMLVADRNKTPGLHGLLLVESSAFSAFHTTDEELLFEGTLRELARAARALPTRPEAHYYRAQCLLLRARPEAALEALDRAIQCDPDYGPARVARGSLAPDQELPPLTPKGEWVPTWAAAEEARERRLWREASEGYTASLRWFQDNGEPHDGLLLETYLRRGLALVEAREFDRAIEDFVVSRTRWPAYLESTFLLGRAYYLRDESGEESAERVFEELYNDPRHRRDATALWIAAVYNNLWDFEAAWTWVEKIENRAVRARCEVVLALELGDWRRGEKAARRALELDPGNPKSHVRFAQTLLQQRRFEEALVTLRRALEIDPGSSEAHFFLGVILGVRQGKYEEALEPLRKAVELNPGTLARAPLAYCLAMVGRLDEACAQCEECIRRGVNEPLARAYYGFALHKKNELDRARAELQESVRQYASLPRKVGPTGRLNRGYRFALHRLALVVEEKGEHHEAVKLYQRVLELHSGDKVARRQLERLERQGVGPTQ